jgi:SAM-dependent methyltransferase
MPEDAQPVGQHYRGELGAEYFAWQSAGAQLGAELELLKFAPRIAPEDTVVDFGCGGGYLLGMLPGRRRVGVEPNEAARRSAAERGLEVVASSAELPDGFADVVISTHALEHTLRPLDELTGIRRILKPDGRLIIWLPLDDWRTQRRADPADINHHLYTWTPLLFANLLDEAGFEALEVRVVAYAWPQMHERLYRILPRRLFDATCVAWSVLRRRRQVMAVARPAPAAVQAVSDEPRDGVNA